MRVFGGLPGAVSTDGALEHRGDPFGEQRALATGRAVAPLPGRGVVAVAGEDRLSWLDSLTSQAVAHLAPGDSAELLVLDPQGRVEHAAGIVDDGETAWLVTDAGHAAGLAAWLHRMRFRLRVAVRDASDEFAVLGGTAAAVSALPVAAPAGIPLAWRDPWPAVSPGGWGYAPAPHVAEGRDWAEALVAQDDVAALERSAAAGELAVAGAAAAEALRIAAARPTLADVDERTVPHELDWLRTAVHLSKGCYRGQETVAKVHNLGHPPRRVVLLHLDGSDDVLPEPGAEVLAEGSAVGHVTSVTRHFEDGPIALAVLRRSAPTDGDLVVVAAEAPVAARQQLLVPPDAGAAAAVPRLPRLGRRPAAG